jgi:hypothetical protein
MSNRLLDNRSFNKLAVNRLEAQAIRSDNVQPSQPSYLFSVLLENGTFERNNTGGTLTFDLNSENNNVIQFSDRPFRQTQNISLTDFVDLFTLGDSNSFEEDPPNMILAHSQEQRTYKMKLSSQSNNQVVFTLELLPGETHNLNTVTGRMSVFVDDGLGLSDNSRNTFDDGQRVAVVAGLFSVAARGVRNTIQARSGAEYTEEVAADDFEDLAEDF